MYLRLIAASALALLPAGIAFGQQNPDIPFPEYDYSPSFDPVPQNPSGPVFIPPDIPGSTPTPSGGNPVPGDAPLGTWAAQTLQKAAAYCDALPDDSYQIDCISERLSYVAKQIRTDKRYVETSEVLEYASRSLADTARQYRDTSRGPKNFRTADGYAEPQTSTRPLRPISPERATDAVAAARAILTEAETVLLRSSDTDPGVTDQVKQIAAAVGSNKLLLRSV